MDIVAERVGYVYGSGTPFEKEALRDVSFHIPAGSFTGVIGQTGSGKSTLIQHLNGLLRPSHGTLRVGDTLITSSSKHLAKLRRKVGMVFQYPEHQLFEETVARDVAFGPRNLGLSDDEVHVRVEKALEQVGLDDAQMADKSPLQLSGGQMRRVAIAGVLAMEPQTLVLDEPTAGLDPKGRKEILNMIADLRRTREMTIIFVSHSMEDVARFADHLLVLHQGTVALEGTPEAVFREEEILKGFGLDIPYVLRWLKEVNRFISPPIPEALYTEDELADEVARRWVGRKVLI